MGLVLILEPEEVNAARIRAILESTDTDFSYELTESVERALDVLEENDVDVFVGDMHMLSVMTGTELFSTVEMMSPDTVRVVMTDGGRINETIAFMNECRTFKIIIKPCRVADDLITPIQAAIRYKRTMERIALANKEAEQGQDATQEEYRGLRENWRNIVSEHKRAVHVLTDLLDSNLALDGMLTDKIRDRLKRWYQWMIEEYVEHVIEGEGDYEATARMMTAFAHDPAHDCTFLIHKRTREEILPEAMKEMTFLLRIITGVCKDLMRNWHITVVIESVDKAYILRVRYEMEGTDFRIRNEAMRNALIRATELGVEAVGCKTAVIPREKEKILNIALPRNEKYNAQL